MTFRFETAQRVALSFVSAVVVAAIAVSAAVPVLPVA